MTDRPDKQDVIAALEKLLADTERVFKHVRAYQAGQATDPDIIQVFSKVLMVPFITMLHLCGIRPVPGETRPEAEMMAGFVAQLPALYEQWRAGRRRMN
jgi:hypothetical protein